MTRIQKHREIIEVDLPLNWIVKELLVFNVYVICILKRICSLDKRWPEGEDDVKCLPLMPRR
jgi:hypothetical protein